MTSVGTQTHWADANAGASPSVGGPVDCCFADPAFLRNVLWVSTAWASRAKVRVINIGLNLRQKAI
jgi:hypothetical protein